MQRALHHLLFVNHHIIPQIVKSIFVVCAVSNIARIIGPAFIGVHIMNDKPYTHAQKAVDLPHPLAVALCQVIIDCNDVHAFTFQRV